MTQRKPSWWEFTPGQVVSICVLLLVFFWITGPPTTWYQWVLLAPALLFGQYLSYLVARLAGYVHGRVKGKS